MPEYDYTIDDIQHIEVNIKLSHLPDPHAAVEYRVRLKNGESRDDTEGEIRGVLTAEIALLILGIKQDLRGEKVQAVQPAPQKRSWRNRG